MWNEILHATENHKMDQFLYFQSLKNAHIVDCQGSIWLYALRGGGELSPSFFLSTSFNLGFAARQTPRDQIEKPATRSINLIIVVHHPSSQASTEPFTLCAWSQTTRKNVVVMVLSTWFITRTPWPPSSGWTVIVWKGGSHCRWVGLDSPLDSPYSPRRRT